MVFRHAQSRCTYHTSGHTAAAVKTLSRRPVQKASKRSEKEKGARCTSRGAEHVLAPSRRSPLVRKEKQKEVKQAKEVQVECPPARTRQVLLSACVLRLCPLA